MSRFLALPISLCHNFVCKESKIFYLDSLNMLRVFLDDWVLTFTSKEVLSQQIENVCAKNAILLDFSTLRIGVFDNGNVQCDYFVFVGLGNLQWRLQNIHKLRQIFQLDILSSFGIKLLPNLIKQIIVFIRDSFLNIDLCL